MDKERIAEQQRVIDVTEKMAYDEQIAQENLDYETYEARKALLKNGQLKIRDGNEDALRESSFRVKQHEDELAMAEHRMEQWEHQKLVLSKMKENPYFGRIDFQDGEDDLTLYFGISSYQNDGIHYVYDWRAPVANLFYSDHLGEQTYPTTEGQVAVDLKRKRQFIIRNRQIEVMEDTDQAIGDDVLLQVLSDDSTSHMKQIVSTIQHEQNKLIRSSHPYLLIEGVAGSGKTSVLMQRMAYLLYQERTHLTADDMLMLSPNPVFSEYVSQVLPSLGEENIYRIEWEPFVEQMMGHEVIDCPAQWKSIQNWLQSMEAVKHLEAYFESLKNKGIQFKRIPLFDDTILVTQKQLAKSFHQLNHPEITKVWQQIDLLQQQLERQLHQWQNQYAHSEEMEKRLDVEGGEIYDQLMSEDPTKSFDEVREDLTQILAKQTFKRPLQQVKQMRWINYYMQYIHFLNWMTPYVPTSLQDEWTEYIHWVQSELKQGKMTLVDSQYYFILRKTLTQQSLRKDYQWIFIDEVQDYTPLNITYLASAFPKASYTMAGDTNQLIFHNQHALSDMEKIFKHDVSHHQLLTSYRSTGAITQLAAAILRQDSIVKVARPGKLPQILMHPTSLKWLEQVKNRKGRMAIITRTEEEAKEFYQKYHEIMPQLVRLTPGHLANQYSLFVLPLSLAKGLEFDEVIIYNADQYDLNDEKGQIELYTAVTRAMHRLILHAETITPDIQQWSQLGIVKMSGCE